MGGKCCTDRKDATAAPKGGKAPQPVGNRDHRKQSQAGNAYDKKPRALSIASGSGKHDDLDKFDRAFETNDLKAFVSLLPSQAQIETFEERMHPWAEDPRTVGALAGTHLAILASTADKGNPNVKEDIREVGGIRPLVEFLKSDEKDRNQIAVVALSFLTADCSENSIAIYEAGAMPLLMKHLDSDVAGMRAAAATTLRNCCMEGDEYRKKFVELGGIKKMVNELACEADPTLNLADMQLEAVLNIQDLIENDDGSLIEEYAREAIKVGARDKLKKLTRSEDDEVRGSAQEVLEALEAIK